MNRDRLALAQVLERIELAQKFAGKQREIFFAEDMRQEAVIRELEVIGEATSRVSSETRSIDETIPWRGMVGFKNVAVHQYDSVDLDRVWEIVHSRLPGIRAKIRRVLPKLQDDT